MSADRFRYASGIEEDRLLRAVTLPLNHCNLPSKLLASLAYQEQPIPITINTLEPWLMDFCVSIGQLSTADARGEFFLRAMTLRYGVAKTKDRVVSQKQRTTTYRTLLMGWLFDPDGKQGGIWRSWVESRFGLLTRYHIAPMLDPDSLSYHRYATMSAFATHNSHELFAQLDFLYFFCQLELGIRFPKQTHLTLYRGSSTLSKAIAGNKNIYQFNNLSSLTIDPELAFQFGSALIKVDVPLYKIVCFDSLLPGILQGEQEYMVLGGLYRVEPVKYV